MLAQHAYKFCSFFKEPREGGILDVNLLLARSKKTKFCMDPTEWGISPVNELDCSDLVVELSGVFARETNEDYLRTCEKFESSSPKSLAVAQTCCFWKYT